MDFAELILEYVIKICSLSRNRPLPYSNLLTHTGMAFQISLEGEARLDP